MRHEAARKDEGRPLEAGLQKQASNHLKLHWLRASVVSVKEKAWETCQVRIREMSASEPLMRCRNKVTRRQNWRLTGRQDKSRRQSAYCLGDVRHRGGMNLIQAFVWNVGNCRPDAKGDCAAKLQRRWRTTLRNRHAGADSKPPQAAVVKNPTVVSVEEKAH